MNFLSKFNRILDSSSKIKDISLGSSLMAHITGKCLYLHMNFKEHKILKMKGDIPHKVKIINDTAYASTHKGILREWEEKTEIKNIGYVIDFGMKDGFLYALTNQRKLYIMDQNMRIAGTISQRLLGFKIKIHPILDFIAILYSTEIGIYKINKTVCIPVNTIEGVFIDFDWDLEMPWLYAATKTEVLLFT